MHRLRLLDLFAAMPFDVGDHVTMNSALTQVVQDVWAQHSECKYPESARYRGGSARVDDVNEHAYSLTFLDRCRNILRFSVPRADGDRDLTLEKPAAKVAAEHAAEQAEAAREAQQCEERAREQAEREQRLERLLTNMRAGHVEPEALRQPDEDDRERSDAVKKFFEQDIIGSRFIAETVDGLGVFTVERRLTFRCVHGGKPSRMECVLKIMKHNFYGQKEIERMQRMNAVDAARGTRFSPKVLSTRLAFGGIPLGRGKAVLMEVAPGRAIGDRLTATLDSDRVLDIVRQQLPSLMETMAAAGILDADWKRDHLFYDETDGRITRIDFGGAEDVFDGYRLSESYIRSAIRSADSVLHRQASFMYGDHVDYVFPDRLAHCGWDQSECLDAVVQYMCDRCRGQKLL